MKTFLGVIPNEGLLEKMFSQKVAQNFFVHIWGNSGQNPSHPQKCAFSYTNVLHSGLDLTYARP